MSKNHLNKHEPPTSHTDLFSYHQLPRPRAIPILILVALVDLGFALNAIYQAVTRVVDSTAEVGTLGILIWGVGRPLLVLWVVGNLRVREKGWLMLSQLAVC